MDTRQHDSYLALAVKLALGSARPGHIRHVDVMATVDGSVYLRGHVSSHAECSRLRAAVGRVPGVTQVFCNIDIEGS